MNTKQLIKDKSQVNLDLEGGRFPQKGFITMHSFPLPGVDIVWDFNKLPYPFPDNSVNILRADGLLTKVSREDKHFIKFMDECWRILKYEGQFMIACTYAYNTFFIQDPCNINPLNETTFVYFDPLERSSNGLLYKIYKPKPWKITHISFKVGGLMEVLLEKRRIDTSYEKD